MERVLENRLAQRTAATLGVVGSVALGVIYVLLAALVVPSPALYGFWAAWGGLVIVSLLWWRPHPWRTLALPIVGLVAVFAALWLGEKLLGWTG